MLLLTDGGLIFHVMLHNGYQGNAEQLAIYRHRYSIRLFGGYDEIKDVPLSSLSSFMGCRLDPEYRDVLVVHAIRGEMAIKHHPFFVS